MGSLRHSGTAMQQVHTVAVWMLIVSCCMRVSGESSTPANSPTTRYGAVFFESFSSGWMDRWRYSAVKKYKGVFDTVQPEGYQDTAIRMPEGGVHYGMTALLSEPLNPADGIVVQYEVQFAEGHTCGGAYLKLLSKTDEEFVPKKLKSKTPFSIMFGPDRCGPDSRVHVILNMLNPATGEVTEHHLMTAPAPKEDKLSHVYTLVLYSNHRYKVLIDGVEKGSGLLTAADFSPPLQPPQTLPDPEHIKPDDWVEEEFIDDPSAEKPAAWDDRRLIPDHNAQKPVGWLDSTPPRIPDPAATKPSDWNDARDGEWLRPTVPNPECEKAPGCGRWSAAMVQNPAYKGPWIAPQIRNPGYKGPWQQRHIPNPAYFKADAPLTFIVPVVAVAFELWVTEPGYTFDSILIGKGQQGLDAAAAYLRQTWRPRYKLQYDAAMAASRQATRLPGLRHLASNKLMDTFELPLLRHLKPHMAPVLNSLEQNPELAWAVVVVPLLLMVSVVVSKVLNSSKADSLEAAADAAEEQAADEEHKRFLQELAQQRQAAKQATAAAFAASSSVVTANSSDEVRRSISPEETIGARRQNQRNQQQQEAIGLAQGGSSVQTPTVVQQQQQQQQQQTQDRSPDSQDTISTRSRTVRRSSRKS